MKLQVLVATMNQVDHSLIERMGIRSDVIIANQCDRNLIENFEKNGHLVKYLNFAEKGVGLNRNNALMRASGDVCLFADDDLEYYPNYEDIILKSFEKHLDADLIAFNLAGSKVERHVIKREYKVGFFNFLRFGTARIAIRLKSIREKGIYFNQCFGGGTEHCHGEDSVFIADCLKKGLKMYAVPECIGELKDNRSSTWNREYNEKFFEDQGFLYQTISPCFWRFLCLQDAIRHRKLFKQSWVETYRRMTLCKKRGNQ